MDSRRLAAIIGPTLVALGATEALNIRIFEHQIAPVVYLNGAILFVVGLSLIRAHSRWGWSWPTLITLAGWVSLLGGLYRMIAPDGPQAPKDTWSYAMFAVVALVGAVLTYHGYRKGPPLR